MEIKEFTTKAVNEAIQHHPYIIKSELAKLIGITKNGLWYLLSGRRNWSLDNFLKTMAILGLLEVKNGRLVLHLDVHPTIEKELKRLSNIPIPNRKSA